MIAVDVANRHALIPRVWSGETVVCAGTGPSLTKADLDACRGRARVIAVNDAYKLAPWADILYACDAKWWNWHKGAPDFQGRKYAMTDAAAKWPGVELLRNKGKRGLSLEADGICTGHNSSYQAINVAVLSGASRIILIGVDMSGDHFFGSHPDKSKPPFKLALEAFPTLVEPLRDAGVEIFNCSRKTALTCFQRIPLEEALP